MNPSSLFGLTEHLAQLSKHGDPLEVLDATVDFEYFRGWLVEGLSGRCRSRVLDQSASASRLLMMTRVAISSLP